jgi:uncharacterized protein YeaO (DUF488 family)
MEKKRRDRELMKMLGGNFPRVIREASANSQMTNIRIKRAYEEPDREDGTRILVDRLWPRGLTKEKAKVDLWLKGVAPSTELRKWFAHDPGKWAEFQSRYREELKRNEEQVSFLRREAAKGTVTLVYGAKDRQHNEAVILQRLLTTK